MDLRVASKLVAFESFTYVTSFTLPKTSNLCGSFSKESIIPIALSMKSSTSEISIFSFHNPDTKHALSILDYRLSEMINVYSKKIRNSYYYISDSNGYWRYSRLLDLLKNNNEKNIQILIHPEWWQKTAMSPRMRVVRCVDERSKRTLETYDSILKASKRKNIT